MHFSATLSLYLAKKFLFGIVFAFVVLMALVYLIDSVELLRRAAKIEGTGFAIAFQLAALKLPTLMMKLLPFAALFGAVWTYSSLTRSHELVVARSAGVSVWQFLAPAAAIALTVGLFAITVFNPLASVLISRYERIESAVLEGRPNQLAISSTGLWLRQAGEAGQSVIHAIGAADGGAELRDVIVFRYKGTDIFVARIDGESASLKPGKWIIHNAVESRPDKPAIKHKAYILPTDLTLEAIRDSLARPETLSFWSLPGFIKNMESAGFSALRHRLHWQSLLALPLLLCAMVLLAAAFSMRENRRGRAGLIIVSGVMASFLLYFISDIVSAFGLAGNLPIVLAAWTPTGVAMLLGLTLLFHLEDG